MTTVTKSFTALGLSAEFSIKPGESADYSVTGTFVGFVTLERQRRPGVWERISPRVADTGFTGSVINEGKRDERYRFRAEDTDGETAFSGTAVATIADATGAAALFEVKDKSGNVVFRVDDAGAALTGALAVSGAAAVVGKTTTGSGIGAPNTAATCVVEEKGDGVTHQTVITLTNHLVSVTDALAYANSKLYTFPEGRIYVMAALASLAFGVTGVRADTINDNAAMDWSLGTVAASNVTLATTMVDLIAKQDKTLDGVAAAYTTAQAVAGIAPTAFDGTSTAKEAHLNVSFPTTTDIDADGVVKVTGTITITWINFGDL